MGPEHRHLLGREDAVLLAWAALLGLVGACLFAAYRAVSLSADETAERVAEFVQTLAWPGILIFGGIAAAVVLGWKANLD